MSEPFKPGDKVWWRITHELDPDYMDFQAYIPCIFKSFSPKENDSQYDCAYLEPLDHGNVLVPLSRVLTRTQLFSGESNGKQEL